MDECEFVTFISLIACSMAKCYTEEEIGLFAAAFNQLGDTLETLLAKRELCSSKKADIT
ncbi:DUF6774 domain-containing protein [Konateibacter massiliensis]|uniref:DUF6774 domain-containing protein n=1 Tax=Konateibacter massiliensis TaxID=2002841 RepID=UPI0015D4D9AE|nr:DUF6774 domain-containing protein [Konateibacter massiliensis]